MFVCFSLRGKSSYFPCLAALKKFCVHKANENKFNLSKLSNRAGIHEDNFTEDKSCRKNAMLAIAFFFYILAYVLINIPWKKICFNSTILKPEHPSQSLQIYLWSQLHNYTTFPHCSYVGDMYANQWRGKAGTIKIPFSLLVSSLIFLAFLVFSPLSM